jgi:hypothetical protein
MWLCVAAAATANWSKVREKASWMCTESDSNVVARLERLIARSHVEYNVPRQMPPPINNIENAKRTLRDVPLLGRRAARLLLVLLLLLLLALLRFKVPCWEGFAAAATMARVGRARANFFFMPVAACFVMAAAAVAVDDTWPRPHWSSVRLFC